MESMPPLETVCQALQALYHNPDVTGKEKASVWLGELQRSIFAWQVSDQLLQLNQDIESCYFAAQTMRTKIQYSFIELPASAHESLRDSLMNHCTKITQETPVVITTQLCLALADLALQMASWKNATTDLMQKFGENVQHWHFLIELLTVLPEEINSRSLRLGANRRNEVTEELIQSSGVMIQLLTAVREAGGGDTRLDAKVFRCLGSWFNVCAIPQQSIISSKLLTAPFEVLMDKDCPNHLHEAASDCVCSALYAAEDLEKNVELARCLLEGVMTLPEGYHMSVALEDLDKSLNYCRVFTEMAESFLDIIASSPGQGFGDLQTLELLLTCVGHHQYEVADITFNFWYRLSEQLYKMNNDEQCLIFKPYIQRLIVALARHCQYEPDHEGIPECGDEFVDFRARVTELIKDVVFVVGSSSVFSQMFEGLKSQTSDSCWDSSEAALFVMCAVAKNITPDEQMIVPQVLQAVLHLPATAHPAVRYTSLQLVGELCEWIEKHPDILDPVLQFLLAGLQQPPLATVAANSLQNTCSQCRDQMTQHFAGLLQIVEAIESFQVSNDAALGLLKGTAMILAKMPHDKITSGLSQLCSMQIAPLNKIIDSVEVKVVVGSKQDPVIWLDRLAAIFRHTNPTDTNGQSHPCQPVIQEVWPVVSRAWNKYQADVRVIERCCRCIRFAVRCLGKDSAALLTPLVTQMVALYTTHAHSCFLYLGSILVDEYGADSGCVTGLLGMLQAFCPPTFKMLEEQNGLRNHPDTVDDLFRLCLRFTQKSPVAFLQTPLVRLVVCCGIAACALDHRDANASVTKFFSELVKTGREKEDREDYNMRRGLVTDLLKEHGPALVQAIMHSCVFVLPTYMIIDSADIIYQLMLFDRPELCVWLEQGLKSLPPHIGSGAVTATTKQLADFHKSITIADEGKTVSRAMRDFARLYR